MIHFRCRCGPTLSAEESAAGQGVRCVSCGHDLTVPSVTPTGRLRSSGRRDTGTHDFDAEITAAARTAPARPRKTPNRVTSPEFDGPPEEEAGDPPSYDLIGMAVWADRLGPLSWVALVLFAAAAGGAFELLREAALLRWLVVAVLLATGVFACVLLRVLREVCRATLGLAQRQREMVSELSS